MDLEQLDHLSGDAEAHGQPPRSATISTRTPTSGCTFSIRILGGSMPKSWMSKVDSPRAAPSRRPSATPHLLLVAPGDAPEGELAPHQVPRGVVCESSPELAVDRRIPAGVDPAPELAILERIPRRQRSTGNSTASLAGCRSTLTPPSSTSTSRHPSSPSVLVSIGWRLERGSDEHLRPFGHDPVPTPQPITSRGS